MRITIVASGRLKSSSTLSRLISDYLKPLSWKVTTKEIDTKSHEKNYEKTFLDAIPKSTMIIALDAHGRNLSSVQLAHLIEHERASGQSHFSFLIGGADGLPNQVKKVAHHTISFGKNTWPHMLVRLMLAEQLYRAQQIMSGHPYHRE